MKEKLHEQISALVDDELAETEQVLLIKQLEGDVTLRHSLLRYQLISDALQNHLPRKIDPDFNIGVQVALQDDPELHFGLGTETLVDVRVVFLGGAVVGNAEADDLGVRGAGRSELCFEHRAKGLIERKLQTRGVGISQDGDPQRLAGPLLGNRRSAKTVVVDLDVGLALPPQPTFGARAKRMTRDGIELVE